MEGFCNFNGIFSMSLDKIIVLIGGIGLIGFIVWYFLMRPEEKEEVKAQEGAQEVRILVERGYTPEAIVAKKGVLLKLIFERKEVDSCSERLLIPEFKINQFLAPNAITEVAFTPDKLGEFEFRCGMGLLHG